MFAGGYGECQGDGGHGERRLVGDVTHRRQVFFAKAVPAWVVVDIMATDRPHRYTNA